MASDDPIDVYRGESRALLFAMTPPSSIAGWTILLTVKRGGTVYISEPAIIMDAGAGTFRFDLTAVDTAGLPVGNYQYDVWRMDAGQERVMAVGLFAVSDVARL